MLSERGFGPCLQHLFRYRGIVYITFSHLGEDISSYASILLWLLVSGLIFACNISDLDPLVTEIQYWLTCIA